MKRRIAIVGLGAAARTIHIPACSKLLEVEVVGGFDPSADPKDFSFPLYPSLKALLESTHPDIVTVATPTWHHYEAVQTALKAGCHVFCEKPFMNSLREAEEIVALSRKLNLWVVVNQQFRFMNVHRVAQSKIGDREFGDLTFLVAHQTFVVSAETEAGWRGTDNQRTCKEFGIHVLDLCRFFFCEEPRSIIARMPKGDHPEGPDYLNLIQLEFSRDRVAQIIIDRVSRGRHRYLDMRLDGTQGTIETRLGGAISLTAGIRGGARKPFLHRDLSLGGRARLYHGERFRKIASDPLDLFPNATRQLLKAFVEAINSDTVPPCTDGDNLRSLALMFAAYRSSDDNRAVPLSMSAPHLNPRPQPHT